MNHSQNFLNETIEIAKSLDKAIPEKIVSELIRLRKNKGRLFFLGVGGSAANASHAVNDFRKLCGIESYSPAENIAELTARVNDEGWDSVFSSWLETSKLSDKDMLFILSVGGGDVERNVSINLVEALKLGVAKNVRIVGIVGRDGGYLRKVSKTTLLIPVVNPKHVTPHSESFQSIILHCIVSHPDLQINKTKW